MKKLITSLVAGSLMAGSAIIVAAPSVDEVKQDIADFQGYFLKKYLGVSLEQYQGGGESAEATVK